MLPLLTTMDDIDTWVTFLKTKINGAGLKDAESIIGKQYIDGRKLSSLQFWDFLTKDGDHISLSTMGWDYSRATTSGKASILRNVLADVVPYKAILEWAHFQAIEQITTVDVGSRWLQFNKSDVQTENENTLNNNAVCFFHVAQGAGLGKLVIGRRGQPTRLELDRVALGAFVNVESAVNQESATSAETDGIDLESEEEPAQQTLKAPRNEMPTAPLSDTTPDGKVVDVFIGHSKNTKIMDQVKTILAFGNFEPVVAEDEETTAVPVPEKVMDAMHKCRAGIMIISADEPSSVENGAEHFAINDNVLIEVGAAFVLYKRNVILLVDRRVDLPSNLQGLYECRYEGDTLDFDSAMSLQQALIKFRE